MSGWADGLDAGAILDVVTEDAAETFLEGGVKLKAFNGDVDAFESINVLAGCAVDDDGSAGAVGVQLEEVTDAGETLAGIWVKSGAGGRDIEAGEVGDPLVASTGHLLGIANTALEDVVGILAGEAVSGEVIKGVALSVDIEALSVFEVLSGGTLSVGQAVSVLEGVSGDAGRASLGGGVKAGTGETARAGRGSASLEVSVEISKIGVVGAGISISLECSPAHESVLKCGFLDVADQVESSW